MEQWRDIPGWEGFYQVSDHGHVRSVDRVLIVPNRRGYVERRHMTGRLLSLIIGKAKYPQVMLSRPGKSPRPTYVHELVLLAFIGPRPAGLDICHNDDNRTNNKLSNLRYDTRSANAHDATRNGKRVIVRGEDRRNAKLSASTAQWIRVNASALSERKMAAMLGVSRSTVCAVLRGRSWAHVP